MGTVEILIVFSALMALIALVTIGIDWIGKPLKHRRFIPRIYRFDDEKLPTDAYGHATLDAAEAPLTSMGPAAPIAYVQPQPIVVATVPDAETQVPPERQTEAVSTSAFSDSLAEPGGGADPTEWIGGGLVPAGAVFSTNGWQPGMPLDATQDDRKPNLAVKAERFWKATADQLTHSHFDQVDLDRMASGKAPRRINPRSGRTESMQLAGLRQASKPDQVSMRWPDDSVDPWNAA